MTTVGRSFLPPTPARELASEPLLGLDSRPTPRRSWWPSVLGLGAAGVLARLGHWMPAATVGGLVLTRTILSLVSPELVRVVESALARGAGARVADALLVPPWLLFFVPLGLATRRRREMFEGSPTWLPAGDEGPDHTRWS